MKLTENFKSIDKKITTMTDSDGLVQTDVYEFNLKNVGNGQAKFDLKLVNEVPSDYTGNVLDTKYIKVGLEINGEEHGPFSLEEVNNIIDSDIIYTNEMINYTLRIWLDEEKEEEEELLKLEDYKAFLKLKVEAEQRVDAMDNDRTTVFSYTGGVQEYQTNRKGYYYIELAGGNAVDGKSAGSFGGYNGGGDGTLSTFNNRAQGGGGGATDVRLVDGSSDDTSSLISRIMVAGGGGGADFYVSTAGSSYLFGVNGTVARYSTSYTNPDAATGGTQISGNAFGIGGNAGGGGTASSGAGAGGSSYISGYAGVNSVKESTTISHTSQTLHYSGKYFVGGTITPNFNLADGYAKIRYEGTELKEYNKLDNVRYIKDCISYNIYNSQNHWVELQAIKDGVNVAKGKTVIGTTSENSSYPYSRITDGDLTYSNYATVSSQAENQCVIVDLEKEYNLDEIAIWHYFGDKRMYKNNIVSVSSDNTNWFSVMDENIYETSNGKRINRYTKQPSENLKPNISYEYSFLGTPQTFWVPKTGKYKIELWGAGADTDAFNKYLTELGSEYIDDFAKIGVGGYASGEIELSENDLLYVYVGKGGYIEYNKSTSNTGGYNGGCSGGAAGSNTAYKYHAGMSGAGGVDIRLVRDYLYSDVTSLRSRIMVAGSGGGSINSTSKALYSSNGGGLSSYKGYSEQGDSYGGASATQTSGNAFGVGGAGANTGGGTYCSGHAGGGYYGGFGGKATGGNCYMSGGGGGSSYISGHTGCVAVASSSSSSAKSGCTTGTSDNSCSIHYSGYKFTNTVMIDGSGYEWTNVKGSLVQMPSIDGGYYPLTFGHDGHGFARITFLG